MKSNSVSPARLAAFEILRRVEGGAYASILLTAAESDLSPADRGLTRELVLGVLRRQLWLDSLIRHFAERDPARLDPAVRIALRVGIYQLRFLSRIPASAAVNESVNLVRLARLKSAEGFTNAILRRSTREPDYDPLAAISDPVGRLSIESSHPRWLLERWIEEFGFAPTSEFARVNNEVPPLSFRIVQNLAKEAEVLSFLRMRNGEVIPSNIVPGGWRIAGPPAALFELAALGKVYIQDEASQLVGSLMAARAGDRVLDLCSAPGSKTTQIADLAGDQAILVAADLHEARLRTVAQTARLQGLTSIQSIVLDGLVSLPFADSAFDAVLVDAPCSGTGTLRRNPEIRWRITAADIQDLSSRQKQLLIHAAKVVKPGGRLVYSTCSVERDENENVVEDFLANHDNFSAEAIKRDSKHAVSLHSISTNSIRTWPQRDGADGFFIATLRRIR